MSIIYDRAHVRMIDDDRRKGVVTAVYATTARVKWHDGSETRVPKGSLVVRSSTAAEHAPRKTAAAKRFTKVERRFDSIVQKRMAELGLTWDDIEQRAGVSRSSIARIARGDGDGGRVSTIERLALALQVPPGEFWLVS